ncbi:MAG: DUF4271 domain-containing protein [Bacteroidales bacterium]|jgi:hypothetical protein|nr:DUF4271 domain-containing protein [Bacteroidales bacterium]
MTPQEGINHTWHTVHLTNDTCIIRNGKDTLPLSEALCGKYSEFSETDGSGRLNVEGEAYYLFFSFSFILIAFFFIAAFSKITEGAVLLFSSVHKLKKVLAIDKNVNDRSCRNFLLFFVILLSGFLAGRFVNFGETPPYMVSIYIFAICAIFLTVRLLILKLLGWVNSSPAFGVINRMGLSYFALIFSLALVITLIYVLFFRDVSVNDLYSYIFICTSVILIIYFIRVYQIIISNGFSIFFWILYLCTLEILPSAALIFYLSS